MNREYNPGNRSSGERSKTEITRIYEGIEQLFESAKEVVGDPVESNTLYVDPSLVYGQGGSDRAFIFQKSRDGASLSIVEKSGTLKSRLTHAEIMILSVGQTIITKTSYAPQEGIKSARITLQGDTISGGAGRDASPSVTRLENTEFFSLEESSAVAQVIIGEMRSAIDDEAAQSETDGIGRV